MLTKMKHTLITLLQLILVVTFLIYEEVIWEGVAKPVYAWVHSLRALQRVERWLQGVNAVVILVLFTLLLVSVEMLGIYAGVMFVSGNAALGVSLYLTKVPIAAFTFWMFRVTEEKLMRFGWFKWIYEKIMAFIEWLKSLEIYQSTMALLKRFKEKTKVWLRAVKIRYFSRESPFVSRLKRLYRSLKQALRK